MPLYTSSREGQFWIWAFVVVLTIFSTLIIGQPLIRLLGDQNVRAVFFLLGMALVGLAIILHALKTKPGKIELVLILGIVAVYVMFFLRLGMPERSHLIEYSVLAILIHKALVERKKHSNVSAPALIAFIATFLIGVLDESIQIFLPDRVFDAADILFNGSAVAMAIGSSVLMTWVRRLRNNS